MTDYLSVTQFQSGGLVGFLPHTKELPVVCVCAKLLQSCLTLYDPMDCSPPGSSARGIFQATILEWVAIPSPGIFPTQGSNPGLPHCRQILYRLSHKGSPRTLEWVA